MRKSLYILLPLILLASVSFSQRPTMELTFTAIDSATWVQLDSIKVMNRTQGGDTMLYYPDTVLVLDYAVGVPDIRIDDRGFEVYQNYPNPVSEQTTISMNVPESGQVSMIVTDILGRVLIKTDRVLYRGVHSFRLIPGNSGIVFFSAQWEANVSSIKILRANHGSSPAASLEFIGGAQDLPELKSHKDILEGFDFSLGDELLFIGYTDTLESGILNAPEESQTYTFQFAYGIPCPGTPTVSYEGQVYNTVQIFSQCWLKENLNVGTMIQGDEEMTDNGIMEKYCYDNEPDSCVSNGGLYQWNEMMQYTVQQGTRGICPEGWHLPTDEEWKVLEGSVDSQYSIGNSEWDGIEWRGYNAGLNLKNNGWYAGGNGVDLYGFNALPGGVRFDDGVFDSGSDIGDWWSSSSNINGAVFRSMFYDHDNIGRGGFYIVFGFSVRCVRD